MQRLRMGTGIPYCERNAYVNKPPPFEKKPRGKEDEKTDKICEPKKEQRDKFQNKKAPSGGGMKLNFPFTEPDKPIFILKGKPVFAEDLLLLFLVLVILQDGDCPELAAALVYLLLCP